MDRIDILVYSWWFFWVLLIWIIVDTRGEIKKSKLNFGLPQNIVITCAICNQPLRISTTQVNHDAKKVVLQMQNCSMCTKLISAVDQEELK